MSILHIIGLRTQRNQLDLDSNTTKSYACSWDTQHVHPQLVTWRELCEEEWGAQGPLGGPGYNVFYYLLTLKPHKGQSTAGAHIPPLLSDTTELEAI